MPLATLLKQLRPLLDEMATTDLGYPQGAHAVRPPLAAAVVRARLGERGLSGVRGLADLYGACDGLDLPDVHVGYFIHPLDRVLAPDPASVPHALLRRDGRSMPVLTFGSDGGGTLFAVELTDGGVLLLPPGELYAGRYREGQPAVRQAADDLEEFVARLVADVAAFVRDDRTHVYMAGDATRK